MAVGEVDPTITTIVRQANDVLNKILGWVIQFAPIGVFAIAFDFQSKFSGAILTQLVTFMMVVFAATMAKPRALGSDDRSHIPWPLMYAGVASVSSSHSSPTR